MAPPVIPIESRFVEKYRVDEESGCWLWTASLRANGYSQFRYSKSRNGYGHIFAYEHFVGPVPANTTIDHLCRNRACVNPAHLEAVTHQVNVLRGEGEAAKNARKTHCPQGHPYEGDNLYVNQKTGRRTCRACQKAANERWRASHHAEYNAYHREYTRQWREGNPEAKERARENQRAYQQRLLEDARKWRESQN